MFFSYDVGRSSRRVGCLGQDVDKTGGVGDPKEDHEGGGESVEGLQLRYSSQGPRLIETHISPYVYTKSSNTEVKSLSENLF